MLNLMPYSKKLPYRRTGDFSLTIDKMTAGKKESVVVPFSIERKSYQLNKDAQKAGKMLSMLARLRSKQTGSQSEISMTPLPR